MKTGKKILIAILALCISFSLCSCDWKQIEKNDAGKSGEMSMFIEVEGTEIWHVVYHKETKVMYVVSSGPYNAGTFTLLVDDVGKPLLWKGD